MSAEYKYQNLNLRLYVQRQINPESDARKMFMDNLSYLMDGVLDVIQNDEYREAIRKVIKD